MGNSTFNQSEQLQRYFDGEMDAAEKAAFEQLLRSNKELQEEHHLMQLARQAILDNAIREKVSKARIGYEMNQSGKVRSLNRGKIIRYTAMSVAAGVLVFMLVFGYNLMTLSPEKLFASNYQPFEIGTMRSGSTIDSSVIISHYESGNYEEVISRSQATQELTVMEEFLVAVAYLELNDPQQAIREFRQVLKVLENNSILAQSSEFYLGLSYLRAKEYDDALTSLEKIRNDPNHIYHSSVDKSLLRKIRVLKWRS